MCVGTLGAGDGLGDGSYSVECGAEWRFNSYSSYRIGIPNGVGFLSYRSTSLLSREPTRGRPQLIFLPASGVPWFLQAEGRTKSDLEAPRCQVLRMADQCERNPLCSRGFKHRGHGGHCCIGKLSKPHKGDSTVEMAKQVRETAAAKPRADQCERNPNCTRGFKHGGKGGHCSFVQAATASSLRQSSGSGKGGSSISISTIGSATASSSRRTARQASLDEARSKPGASGGGGGSGGSGSSGGSDSSGGSGGGSVVGHGNSASGRVPRYAGACVHVLDAVQQCMPEMSLLMLLGRSSLSGRPPSPAAASASKRMGLRCVTSRYADMREPLPLSAFRVTESAWPHLPVSLFERGSGRRANPERLANLVIEGLFVDTTTSRGGDETAGLWAGGVHAVRLQLRPLDVILRVRRQGSHQGAGSRHGARTSPNRSGRSSRSHAEGATSADANAGDRGGERSSLAAWEEEEEAQCGGSRGLPTADGAAARSGRRAAAASAASAAANAAASPAHHALQPSISQQSSAAWVAWYEIRTDHAVYALQLPDRSHAEWFASGDGARLRAVTGVANAAAQSAPSEAFITFYERILASRVREADLFANARFVRTNVRALCRVPPHGGHGPEPAATDTEAAADATLMHCSPLHSLLLSLHSFEKSHAASSSSGDGLAREGADEATLEGADEATLEAKVTGAVAGPATTLTGSTTGKEAHAPPAVLPDEVEYDRAAVAEARRTSIAAALPSLPPLYVAISPSTSPGLQPPHHAPPYSPDVPEPPSPHDVVPFEAGQEWEAQRLIGRRVVVDERSEGSPASATSYRAAANSSSATNGGGGEGSSAVVHIEYLVRWKGWSAEHATWEPLRNLSGCRALLRQFHREAKTEAVGECEVKAAAQLASLEAYIVRCGGSEEMLEGWDVVWQTSIAVGGNKDDVVVGEALPGSFVSPTGIIFRSPFEVKRHLKLGSTSLPRGGASAAKMLAAAAPASEAPPSASDAPPSASPSTAPSAALSAAPSAAASSPSPSVSPTGDIAAVVSPSPPAARVTPLAASAEPARERVEERLAEEDAAEVGKEDAAANASAKAEEKRAAPVSGDGTGDDVQIGVTAVVAGSNAPPESNPRPVPPSTRCKRHRLCSRGASHPGSCRLPPTRKEGASGKRKSAAATTLGVSEGLVLCGVALWAAKRGKVDATEDMDEAAACTDAVGYDDGGLAAAMSAVAPDAAQRRRIEASTAGLDYSQCERHPLCVRGYKHGGRGGHCALPAGATGAPHVSSRRARHLRLADLNAGREARLAFSEEEESLHRAAVERRRASGKRVTFGGVSYAPDVAPSWSTDDEEDVPAGSSWPIAVPPRPMALMRREVDAAAIITTGVAARGHRPLRSSMPAARTGASVAAAPPRALPTTSSLQSARPPVTLRSKNVSVTVAPQSREVGGIVGGARGVGAAVAAGGGGGRGATRRGGPTSTEPCERDPNCVRGFRHCGWGGVARTVPSLQCRLRLRRRRRRVARSANVAAQRCQWTRLTKPTTIQAASEGTQAATTLGGVPSCLERPQWLRVASASATRCARGVGSMVDAADTAGSPQEKSQRLRHLSRLATERVARSKSWGRRWRWKTCRTCRTCRTWRWNRQRTGQGCKWRWNKQRMTRRMPQKPQR